MTIDNLKSLIYHLNLFNLLTIKYPYFLVKVISLYVHKKEYPA